MTLSGRFTLALCLLAISLLAAPPATARLYITEFLAENSDGLRDSDGDSSDWIEIFNGSEYPENLEGYGLSDDIDDPLNSQTVYKKQLNIFKDDTGRLHIKPKHTSFPYRFYN